MKSYTRKQMLEVKAKLKGVRQEVNRRRKLAKVVAEMHREEILRYRIDLVGIRKELSKVQNLLKEANRKKWYQFREVK